MGQTISRRGFTLGVTSGLMAGAPLSASRAQGARLKTTIANAAGNLNLAVQELLRQQGFMASSRISSMWPMARRSWAGCLAAISTPR